MQHHSHEENLRALGWDEQLIKAFQAVAKTVSSGIPVISKLPPNFTNLTSVTASTTGADLSLSAQVFYTQVNTAKSK